MVTEEDLIVGQLAYDKSLRETNMVRMTLLNIPRKKKTSVLDATKLGDDERGDCSEKISRNCLLFL